MLGAALALAPTAAVPTVPKIGPVVRVACLGSTGSAVRITRDLLVSVKHVTKGVGCAIDGKFINVWHHPTRDFSIITMKGDGPRLKFDCGGFVKGRTYLATGYARGLHTLTTIEIKATGERIAGFDALWGVFTVIPGQSGGAMIDKETGKLVGVIAVFDPFKGLSGSVPLSETSICQKVSA